MIGPKKKKEKLRVSYHFLVFEEFIYTFPHERVKVVDRFGI